MLAEIAAEHPDAFDLHRVDIDAVPDLVVRYGIASAPTMLLVVDGRIEERIVGARSKAVLLEWLADHL